MLSCRFKTPSVLADKESWPSPCSFIGKGYLPWIFVALHDTFWLHNQSRIRKLIAGLQLFFSSGDSNLNLTSQNLRHSKDALFPLRQQMARRHFLNCPGSRRCLNEATLWLLFRAKPRWMTANQRNGRGGWGMALEHDLSNKQCKFTAWWWLFFALGWLSLLIYTYSTCLKISKKWMMNKDFSQ